VLDHLVLVHVVAVRLLGPGKLRRQRLLTHPLIVVPSPKP
jgi:hypothetical protein